MIWKLQYSSQQFPLSLSPLSCAPHPRFPQLSDKSCTSCSLSPSSLPMSGAFSMALNATPPYFIEHVVGWCWIPPQCVAMGSCIRDVSFGTRGRRRRRMERKYKKDEEGLACVFLCFGGLHGSRCYLALAVLVHARCKREKKKSMSVLTDSLSRIRALWVLFSSVYLTVAHWLVFSYQQVCLILFFFFFSGIPEISVRYLTTRNWKSDSWLYSPLLYLIQTVALSCYDISAQHKQNRKKPGRHRWFLTSWVIFVTFRFRLKAKGGLFEYLRLSPIALHIQ